MVLRRLLALLAMAAVPGVFTSCAEESGSVPEVPESEITAEVPALDAIHEIMVPMWHDAWPAGDVEAVRNAVPEFEPLVADLQAAELPGILQDKQPRWDEQKQVLVDTFQEYMEAAQEGDREGTMAGAEAFHMAYEGMVRIIRPLVPELEAFHQELYGLYHYYAPGYDLEKIRASAEEMAGLIPSLRAVSLPDRVAEHQEEWDRIVDRMAGHVDELLATLDNPSRDEVKEAVETVHTDYQELEGLFTGGGEAGHDGGHD